MILTKLIMSIFLLACLLVYAVCANPVFESGLIVTMTSPPTPDPAIIYSHFGLIAGLPNVTSSPSSIPVFSSYLKSSSFAQFYSCDIDYDKKILYLYEFMTSTIYTVQNYNWQDGFANMKIGNFHRGISSSHGKLAVDWVSHNLYWVDELMRWIVVQPGNPVNVDENNYRVIVDEDLERPLGLAVDPIHRYIFWSDVGKVVKIERSSLTGSDRMTLVSTGLLYPVSLDVDLPSSRLIWVDKGKDTVESSKFDGTDRRVIIRLSNSHFLDVAVIENALTLARGADGSVVFVDKDKGLFHKSMSFKHGEMVKSLAIYNKRVQPDGTDYCSTASCGDICVGGATGPICLCREGYKLNTDRRTCTEDKGVFHRASITTDGSSICLSDIRTLNTNTYDAHRKCILTMPSGSAITYMDVDITERKIIYASGSTIYSVHIDINTTATVHTATGSITGLGIDWTDKNIYWTMGGSTGSVHVVATDGATYKILNNIDNPRDLVVLPLDRRMFWISGRSGQIVIEAAGMDGTARTTIINNDVLVEPTALAVSRDNNELYWVDSFKKTLSRSKLDGSDLITVKSSTTYKPMLVQVYKNQLLWTEDQSTTYSILRVCDRKTPFDTKHSVTGLGRVVSLLVLDAILQPSQKGPCDTLNGGCEHICIPIGRNRVCKCIAGFQLDANRRGCSSDPMDDNFLLVTDFSHGAIYQVALDTNETRGFDIESVENPTGIVYNHVTKRVIWGSIKKTAIESINLNGTGYKELWDTGVSGSFPDRHTVDYTGGNVFYTAVSNHAFGVSGIGVVSPRGLHKMLITGSFTPRDIVVDPAAGYLFWSVHSTPASVKRAFMDGSEITSIVNRNIAWPNGLAIDHIAQRLFISDGMLNTIQTCTYQGQCSQLYTDTAAHLMDIELLGEYLYYTAWNRPYVTQLHKTNTSDVTRLAQNAELGRLDAVSVYRSSAADKPVSSACAARGGLGVCSTFCLPKPTGFTCACEDRVNLKADGKTCENVPPETVTSTSIATPPPPTTTVPPATTTTTESTTTITDIPTVAITSTISSTTTTTSTSTTSSSNGAPTPGGSSQTTTSPAVSPVILGAGIGGAVLVIVIVILVIILVKRSRRKPGGYSQESDYHGNNDRTRVLGNTQHHGISNPCFDTSNTMSMPTGDKVSSADLTDEEGYMTLDDMNANRDSCDKQQAQQRASDDQYLRAPSGKYDAVINQVQEPETDRYSTLPKPVSNHAGVHSAIPGRWGQSERNKATVEAEYLRPVFRNLEKKDSLGMQMPVDERYSPLPIRNTGIQDWTKQSANTDDFEETYIRPIHHQPESKTSKQNHDSMVTGSEDADYLGLSGYKVDDDYHKRQLAEYDRDGPPPNKHAMHHTGRPSNRSEDPYVQPEYPGMEGYLSMSQASRDRRY